MEALLQLYAQLEALCQQHMVAGLEGGVGGGGRLSISRIDAFSTTRAMHVFNEA